MLKRKGKGIKNLINSRCVKLNAALNQLWPKFITKINRLSRVQKRSKFVINDVDFEVFFFFIFSFFHPLRLPRKFAEKLRYNL